MDLVGMTILSYREHFSQRIVDLDLYSEWKIISIKAECLAGKVNFYAHCQKIAEMTCGNYHRLNEKSFVSVPFMDIAITKNGLPDNYRLIRRKKHGLYP